MIFFVAPSAETWQFNDYLQTYGKELLGRIRILTLDDIVSRQELPLGSYVFVAIDQLLPTEKAVAAQCWQRLRQAAPEITLINDPSEVLLRYDLLKSCFESKRNSFQVYRGSELSRCRKFPLFLRRDRDHEGSIGGLLYTQPQLALAVTKAVLTGYRFRDLIAVEYCDTLDSSKIFRKYSAFIVGKTIVPHALMHSYNWTTKSHGRLIDAATAREELAYVQSNPHAQWLKETFELARIQYGRIDYGVRDGQPQVWEINTNPKIIRGADADPLTDEQIRLRDPIREHFFPRFRAALEAIDCAVDSNRTIPIEVSSRQRRALAAEKQLRQRIQGTKTPISRVTDLLIRPVRQLVLNRTSER